VVAALVFLLITEVIPLLLMILMVHGDSLSSPRRLHFWLFCLPRYHFAYYQAKTPATEGQALTLSLLPAPNRRQPPRGQAQQTLQIRRQGRQ
jgi:hypothetical protein